MIAKIEEKTGVHGPRIAFMVREVCSCDLRKSQSPTPAKKMIEQSATMLLDGKIFVGVIAESTKITGTQRIADHV